MEKNNNNDKVPLSSKVWWVITWIVMLILLTMVGRNFIGSIIYGTSTDPSVVAEYYDSGFNDAKSGVENRLPELNLENPLFVKSYSKGYREGLDKKWESEK